ncbi:MAG: serine/threonine-protein kinase [Pseudomonadota bacterium]
MASSSTFEPVQFGRYLLMERLAVGGMAEIFRAKIHGAHGFEKTLVVKRILPHLAAGDQFVDMFIDEAKVMVRLNHPKVVQVLDFGEEEGQYYIAMEYVEGLDGLALLRKCAKLRCRPTTGIAVHVIGEVLDALDFAHNLLDSTGTPLHIVHRDISPSNIFISALGEVKLGDFGIARGAFRTGQTETGTLKGKYGYMAPEQVDGSSVDKRCDIFSVGVVLAELLMIRRLFVAKNDLGVLLRVRDARLERLDRYGKHIPQDLRLILDAALARDPAMRYQDAATFRDALHRYLFDNRRMVRSTDLRRFLCRLTEEPSKAKEQEVAVGQIPEDVSVPEAEKESIILKGEGRIRNRRVSDTEYSHVSKERVRVPASAISLGLPKQSMTGVEEQFAGNQPNFGEGNVPEGAFDDDTPITMGKEGRPLTPSFSEVGTGAFPEGPRSIGQKRRILLGPPPAPLPVPIGLPQTGESPRLRTADALAAMPEMSPSDSNPYYDFEQMDPAVLSFDALGELSDLELSDAENKASQLTPTARLYREEIPHLKGDLREKSFFKLLFELAVDEADGLLVLEADETVKEIFLVNGDPHFVTSNQANELFGQYLVNKGVISKGELSMSLAVLSRFEGRLGDALVALKLVGPMEVLRHLTHQVRQKLLDSFSWEGGSYFFYGNRKPLNESAPLGLDAFELMGGGIKVMSSDVLQRRTKSMLGLRPQAVSPPPLPPEVFRMGDEPRQIYDRLAGRLTLGEMLSKFDDSVQRESFARIVYLLVETGMAKV